MDTTSLPCLLSAPLPLLLLMLMLGTHDNKKISLFPFFEASKQAAVVGEHEVIHSQQ